MLTIPRLLTQFNASQKTKVWVLEDTLDCLLIEAQNDSRKSGRVGGRVTPAASRRSGLAQLRHPARPTAGSPALCYLPALR